MSKIKVAIIILNYGKSSLKDTTECLASISKSINKKLEVKVFVICYGPNIDTNDLAWKRILRSKFDNLEIIIRAKNLGFANANNIGIDFAKKWNADYFLLLNNDTLVSKNFINELVHCASGDANIGIISPKIYFAKGYEFHKNRYSKDELGKVIWYAGGIIDWNNIYASHRGVDQVDNGQYDQQIQTDFASGCALFITKDVVNKIGGLNADLFMYWEDVDYSIKVRKAKYKVIYCPSSIVWHKNAGSSGVGSELQKYFMTRNRLYMGFKYANIKTMFALLRESIKQLFLGNKWVKKGIKDYYLGKMEIGSWSD